LGIFKNESDSRDFWTSSFVALAGSPVRLIKSGRQENQGQSSGVRAFTVHVYPLSGFAIQNISKPDAG
jgi:hypothetical protein